MTEEHFWVPFDLLEAFVIDVFKGVGVPDADARVCADVLITADRRGIDSHGVGRLKTIYYDRIVKGGIQNPVTEFEVVRDCKATAVVDGHDGMGMVIAQALHADGHRQGQRARTGHGGGAQFDPLRLRGLLSAHGCGGGHDRSHRHQCPPVDRSHPRRGEHARHQPAGVRHAHRRRLPLHQRLRDLGHPARQDRAVGARGQRLPAGPGHQREGRVVHRFGADSARTSSWVRPRWPLSAVLARRPAATRATVSPPWWRSCRPRFRRELFSSN